MRRRALQTERGVEARLSGEPRDDGERSQRRRKRKNQSLPYVLEPEVTQLVREQPASFGLAAT